MLTRFPNLVSSSLHASATVVQVCKSTSAGDCLSSSLICLTTSIPGRTSSCISFFHAGYFRNSPSNLGKLSFAYA